MKLNVSIIGAAMLLPTCLSPSSASADTLMPSATSPFSRAIPPETESSASWNGPTTTMPIRSSSLVFRGQAAPRSMGTVPAVVRLPAVVISPAVRSVVATVSGRDRSLDAAVSRIEASNIRLDGQATCVAQAVYYESKSEPLKGQKAVADVIVNRTRRPGYASSPCGVIRQSGQFTNASRWRVPAASDPLWRRAKAVASLAVSGVWTISESITHFHAAGAKPGWRLTYPRFAAIGHHVFYRH